MGKGFRKSGTMAVGRILQTYRLGQMVDIVGDGAVHKGMPHKFYHGKTGIIWNVTPRAVGVELNKIVGGRQMKKRIHVRIEHVQHSKCRLGFRRRVKDNAAARKAALAKGETANVKRLPTQPRTGGFVKKAA